MASNFFFIIVVLFLVPNGIFCSSSTIGVNLNAANIDGLKKQFQEAMKSFSDISSLHFTIAGIKELGVQLPDTFCNDIKRLINKSDLQSIYHATEAARTLTNCRLPVEEYRSTIAAALQSDKSKTVDIFYAVRSSVNLDLNIDESLIEKRLNALAKTDDSILSQGYALLTAAELSQPIAKYYTDTIDDLIQQADEVDGRFLQYEGGVGTTALLFNAFYEVAEKANEPVKIDSKQIMKFANYFSTKRHAATLRNAYYLTKVFKHLSDNKNPVPVAVTRITPMTITPSNPSVLVSISDLMGKSVGEISVVAESAKSRDDGAVVLSNQRLTPKSNDYSVHELSFYDERIPRGFYTIHLSLTPRDEGTLIGLSDNTIEVKVATEANFENVEFIVTDRDHSTSGTKTKLQYPNELEGKINVDSHQKISLKFQIRDQQSENYIRVQQAFLRFTHKDSNREVIYLAEASNDANVQYKVDVDLTVNGDDFRQRSGRYELVLIIGDALLQNSYSWKLTDQIQLTFHDDTLPEKDHQTLYQPRKEINHQFRKDEKRPPTIVSLIFSAFIILSLLLLLVLWFKIGFNLSSMPLGLSPLGFHLSHGAVFLLMFFYWKYLNMFQTLRYLALILIPLFLFGHRLLNSLAAQRGRKIQ